MFSRSKSRVDLKDTHTSHIEPEAFLCMHNTNESSVAERTTNDRTHAVHVDSKRTNRSGCTAPVTGCLDECHFKREDRVQYTSGSVAVEFVFHYAPPVGPKRSVLMCAGS